MLGGLGAFALALALALDLLTYKAIGFDLAAYILGARRLTAGLPLYPSPPVVLGPFGQYLYPPPLAVVFEPLATLPFNTSRAIMLVLLIAVAAWATWWIVRGVPRPGRYWAAAGTVLFFPLVWEVGLENLTLVTLALCLAAWSWRKRPAPAGLLLGVAVGLKLLPIPLLPFFGAAGRARLLGAAALAVAVAFVITLPLVGAEWGPFVDLLRSVASGPAGTGSNIVPAVFALPLLKPLLPATGLALAILAGIAARSPEREERAFRVGLAAVPLFASTLWYPYLVFALPLLFASPARAPLPQWTGWAARGLAWLLMQMQVVRDPGRDFILPFAGLLMLLGIGMLELRPGQPTRYQSAKRAMSTAEANIATTA